MSFDRLETEPEALEQFEGDLKTILSFFQMMLAEGHALDAFAERARDKPGFAKFKTHMIEVVRELVRLSYGAESAPLFKPIAGVMKTLAQQVSPKAWRDILEKLLWLEGQRRRNLNQSLWFNALSVNALDLPERNQRR